MYSAFVDFRTAFPYINRTLMFYKLLQAGMGGCFLRTLENIYQDVKLCVRIPSGLSPYFEVKRGLKVGCPLSPTLFNLFVRDLPEIFDEDCAQISLNDMKISALQYADDTAIISNS